jgi:NitT/TauT family transport system permease protein
MVFVKTKAVKQDESKAKRENGFVAPLAVLVIIFAGLELFTRGFGIPYYVLPSPSQILYETISHFGDIWPHFLFTLKITSVGFLVSVPIGMVLAALLSQFNLLVMMVTPVVILFVITPMITLIPLLMLWMGTSPNLRVIVVILQATPIITLNMLNGFSHVENEKLELAKSVGATRFQRFRGIIFMNAMPQVFTGIKLGCIFSTIGAVSADFVAGTVGLGFRILQYTKYNLTALSYGCIIMIALIGISLYTIVEAIEKRVVVWKN